MKKLFILCALLITATPITAAKETAVKKESSAKSELKEYGLKAKAAVLASWNMMRKYPVPTIKVLAGGVCLGWGTGKVIGTHPSFGSHLVDAFIGVPLAALGIFLVGNGIEDVDNAK